MSQAVERRRDATRSKAVRSCSHKQTVWYADVIRALREHLQMTQQQLSQELGVRQQTVSEWETGQYRPRGASARLLSIVAERAGFHYQTVLFGEKASGEKGAD